jgi:translation initiation factor 4E
VTMAGYFSNHSQSRYLANSSRDTTANSASTPQSQRARPPSSKHFSTSVATDDRALSKEKLSGGGNETSQAVTTPVHPLRNTYVRNLSRVQIPSSVFILHFT